MITNNIAHKVELPEGNIALKNTDNTGRDKKRLYQAAREMEALFLSQMLKAMRSTIPKVSDDSETALGNGAGKDIYMQMFDEQLAKKLAGTTDKGIAGMVYRSLERVIEKRNGTGTDSMGEDFLRFPDRGPMEISRISATDHYLKPDAVPGTDWRQELPTYENIIRTNADKYNLDPELIRAVIMAESDGDPRAVSPAGAKGLMQLMDGTAREMGVKDVFDPVENIRGGAKYLRRLIDRFQDIRKALAAYNAGPEKVKQHGGIPPFDETRKYVKSVMDKWGAGRGVSKLTGLKR